MTWLVPSIDALRGLERERLSVCCGQQLHASEASQATATARQLRNEGHHVEYVRALLVPGDDAVFHVFVA